MAKKPFNLLFKSCDDDTKSKKDDADIAELEQEIRDAEAEIAELQEELAKAKKKKADEGADDEEVKSITAKLLAKSTEYTQKFAKQVSETQRKFLEAQKGMSEANDRIKHLEGLFEKNAAAADEQKGLKSEAVKSFFDAARKVSQKQTLTADETKALNTLNGPDGGFLCPPEFSNELIKAVIELSDIRAVARVRTISGKELVIPKRIKCLKAYWTKELQEMEKDQSQYGLMSLTPQKLTVRTGISTEMLEDSEFDMAAEILADASEAFALAEGNAFVSGKGDAEQQPQGFISDKRTPVYQSTDADAASGSFSWKDLVKLTGMLKNAYARNAVFGLNRKTLAELMTMTDDMGRPIWQSNLREGRPSTIAGLPYIVIPDMPDMGANATPVVLADWARFYTIVDRTGVSMVIDPYTKAAFGVVEYTMAKRVTGAVVLPEAGILLKCKA